MARRAPPTAGQPHPAAGRRRDAPPAAVAAPRPAWLNAALAGSRPPGPADPHERAAEQAGARAAAGGAAVAVPAGVRLHADAGAAQAARAMNAQAFTVGDDVYFGAGQLRPESRAGQHLLAHELTHVAQQRQGGAPRVQFRLWGDLLDWLDPDPQHVCRRELEEAETWAADGPYPADPLPMAGSGGIGGFSAQYRPEPTAGNGTLQITQGVAVIFKDTLVISGGAAAPHPDLPAKPQTAALAARVNAIPDAAQRAAAIAAYQWAPAEKGPWIARLEPMIEQGWGGQHEFFLNQPRWEWLGAAVAVDLDIGERAKRPADHMDLETFKLPAGETLRNYDILQQVSSGSGRDPLDQHMRLGSTTMEPRNPNLLLEHVEFALGSADLTPAAQTTLNGFIASFNGANAHVAHQEIHVDVVGHTSASGEEASNQLLSEQRAAAVRQYLQDHGFVNVATRVATSGRGEREADQTDPRKASDQRVDLIVDGGAPMVTAMHEWGHAFGLDDEYGAVGSAVTHDAWARDMTDASGAHLPGAVAERNAGVMSYGTEVRPRHYATFHHALQTVTAKSPWSLGAHKAKWQVRMECGDPSPPGDWNLPRRDDGTRTA